MTARLLWPELEAKQQADGWLPEEPQLTSGDVLAALAKRHPMDGWNGMPGRWVFVSEVQAATGSYGDTQRFDAVAVGLVPSTRYARVVYEVKVSRSDWLREMKPIVVRSRRASDWSSSWTVTERHKWEAALAVSTEFWVAAPPRCVQLDELPPEAGFVEVRFWGKDREPRARVVRQAPVRRTPVPDQGFWAAVLRRTADTRRPRSTLQEA